MDDWTSLAQHTRKPEIPVVTRESRRNSRGKRGSLLQTRRGLTLLSQLCRDPAVGQHHSSKASILRRSAFSIVQLSHPYMTTGKTIALTRRTFVGIVMSLLLNMLSRLDITILPRSKRLLISLRGWGLKAEVCAPRREWAVGSGGAEVRATSSHSHCVPLADCSPFWTNLCPVLR